jgi:hypothetical protein
MTPTPAQALTPLTGINDRALEALQIVTRRWLDDCHDTLRKHGYSHLIPSHLHAVK